MIRFLCWLVADQAKLTRRLIGLVFVLGTTTTLAGLSPPQPLMISVQLASRETPVFLISYPRHLYETTTSPSLRLPLQTEASFRESQPQNPNVIVVNNITEPGSMSCALSIILTKHTMAYSLPYVCEILDSHESSKSLPPHQSQRNLSLTSTKAKSVVMCTSRMRRHTTTERTCRKRSLNS